MRHVFLINPRAGKRDRTARIRALADRLAASHGLDCQCLLTDRPGGAEALSRALAEAGESVRLYVCGGDGTVHEAANGLAGFSNAAMTVIPTGTGNDFLKNFGPDAVKFSDPEICGTGRNSPWISSTAMAACASPSPAAASTPASPTPSTGTAVSHCSPAGGVTCCPWR